MCLNSAEALINHRSDDGVLPRLGHGLFNPGRIDGDFFLVLAAFFGFIGLIYFLVGHEGNYTVEVKIGDAACEITEAKSKKIVRYSRVKTVERFEDLRDDRGLYYQFMLLA